MPTQVLVTGRREGGVGNHPGAAAWWWGAGGSGVLGRRVRVRKMGGVLGRWCREETVRVVGGGCG